MLYGLFIASLVVLSVINGGANSDHSDTPPPGRR
jgi:hypothetical protein